MGTGLIIAILIVALIIWVYNSVMRKIHSIQRTLSFGLVGMENNDIAHDVVRDIAHDGAHDISHDVTPPPIPAPVKAVSKKNEYKNNCECDKKIEGDTVIMNPFIWPYSAIEEHEVDQGMALITHNKMDQYFNLYGQYDFDSK